MENWDVIIIGAGSAGLSAGIYTVRSGLKTLILDEKLPGGTISDASIVVNYPGFAEISGGELAEKMVRGRGVSYCGVCDGPFFKGKKVLVVGGGNSACITTLYLSGLAGQVTMIHRREAFRAEESLVTDIATKGNVTILWNTEIQEIKGDKQVKTVTIIDNMTKQTSELAVDAVFVQIGEAPNSQIAKASGIETDEHGYIKIDIHQYTNLPGVFAAGDVTNHPIKQVGTAVGQGITAALEAYSYIRRPYYKK